MAKTELQRSGCGWGRRLLYLLTVFLVIIFFITANLGPLFFAFPISSQTLTTADTSLSSRSAAAPPSETSRGRRARKKGFAALRGGRREDEMRRRHGQGCRTHGRVGGRGLGCVRALLLAGNVKRQGGWWAGLTGDTWTELLRSKKKYSLYRLRRLHQRWRMGELSTWPSGIYTLYY